MASEPNILSRYGPQFTDLPFMQMLTRPMSGQAEMGTLGYSSPTAGAGYVGLQFLEGAREARVQKYLEGEREKRDALTNFINWGETQKARLTPEGLEEFGGFFEETVRGKYAEETSEIGKDKGVGAFIRDMLLGGKMKGGAGKVDLEKARGAWSQRKQEKPELLSATWVNRANEAAASVSSALRSEYGFVPESKFMANPEIQTALGNLQAHAKDELPGVVNIWKTQLRTADQQLGEAADMKAIEWMRKGDQAGEGAMAPPPVRAQMPDVTTGRFEPIVPGLVGPPLVERQTTVYGPQVSIPQPRILGYPTDPMIRSKLESKGVIPKRGELVSFIDPEDRTKFVQAERLGLHWVKPGTDEVISIPGGYQPFVSGRYTPPAEGTATGLSPVWGYEKGEPEIPYLGVLRRGTAQVTPATGPKGDRFMGVPQLGVTAGPGGQPTWTPRGAQPGTPVIIPEPASVRLGREGREAAQLAETTARNKNLYFALEEVDRLSVSEDAKNRAKAILNTRLAQMSRLASSAMQREFRAAKREAKAATEAATPKGQFKGFIKTK